MSQSIAAARDALFTALVALYAAENDTSGSPTLVSYGKPGNYQTQQIIAVMDTRRPVVRPTMGTNRSRRSPAEIDVIYSIFVPGAEVAQQTASDACDHLVGLLETYFRTAPNERLGGACRDAYVMNVDGPQPEIVATKSGGVAGRTATSVVTVSLVLDY
jgi:hypothetical protein